MKNVLKLTLLAGFFALVSCNSDKPKDAAPVSENTTEITIYHDLGETKVKSNPQNVVVLDFAAAEVLDKLGVKIIGMPKASLPSHLEKYKNDESIVDLGTLKEIDYEKLNELSPEVIFISGRLQNDYPEISKIAPAIYTEIDYKNYVESLKKNLSIFGTLFDKKAQTDQMFSDFEAKIATVKEKTKDSELKALVVLHNKGRFSAYGKGSRFGLIHDVLGVKESVENLDAARHGQSVSNEFIQEANPDYLFIIDRTAVVDKEATNKEAIENKLIQQTNAYKNGKIIYLDSETWYLSGGGITSINKMIDEVSSQL